MSLSLFIIGYNKRHVIFDLIFEQYITMYNVHKIYLYNRLTRTKGALCFSGFTVDSLIVICKNGAAVYFRVTSEDDIYVQAVPGFMPDMLQPIFPC